DRSWWRRRRLSLMLRATGLHAAAIRPRRAPAMLDEAPGGVVAFVHRAFASSGKATAHGGEWYIGSVLQQIASNVPEGGLRFVGVGPRKNFRARRWWRAEGGDGTPTLEQFTTNHDAWRQVWRERHRNLRALISSKDLRNQSV